MNVSVETKVPNAAARAQVYAAAPSGPMIE